MAWQPWGRSLAEQVNALSAALVEAELQAAPLGVLLEFAVRLENEVDCYTAAAVNDARSRGASWADVGVAAGVSADNARARWSAGAVRRLLERRAGRQPLRLPRTPHSQRPAANGGPGPSAAGGNGPVGRLAGALSYLQRTSQVSVAEAARQADLSPSYVSRILAGDRLPAWPVVHMLATIFDGSADDVRVLWERAQGPAAAPRQSVDAAAGRFRGALRGLYLAAACPEPAGLCAGTNLSPERIRAILGGDQIPDWPTTAHLVSRLQAPPADIRPLWEDVHYAFLASQVSFPTDGLTHRAPGG
ncbi:helix-turn-helix domain-containing protein [Streptomyces flavidovirens]